MARDRGPSHCLLCSRGRCATARCAVCDSVVFAGDVACSIAAVPQPAARSVTREPLQAMLPVLSFGDFSMPFLHSVGRALGSSLRTPCMVRTSLPPPSPKALSPATATRASACASAVPSCLPTPRRFSASWPSRPWQKPRPWQSLLRPWQSLLRPWQSLLPNQRTQPAARAVSPGFPGIELMGSHAWCVWA